MSRTFRSQHAIVRISKIAVGTTLAAAFAVGCASFEKKEYANGEVPQRLLASAPTDQWVSASADFRVGPGGLHESRDLKIAHVQSWTESVPYQDTCYQDQEVVVRDTCPELRFTTNAGQSPAWNAYFSAKKAEKPARLADAIKGVGDKSAQALVANGYFSSKPRSWEAFAAEMARARDAGVIQKSVYTDTVYTYKEANATTLGYDVQSATIVNVPCDKVVVQPVPYACTKFREQSFSRELPDTFMRHIDVSVSPPELQSFESETITVTLGVDQNSIQLSGGYYNHYRMSIVSNDSNGAKLDVASVGRVQVDLPSEAVRAGNIKLQGGGVVMNLSVDPNLVSRDAKDQLMLRYSINSCDAGLFGCKLGQKLVQGPYQYVPITSPDMQIPIPMGKGKKATVKYSIARPSSHWYNGAYTQERETDSVKVK